MIHFLPTEPIAGGPASLSMHGKLNELVKSLGVVCTGASGTTLFFDRQTNAAKNMPPEQLGKAIIQIIMAQPDILEWIRRASIADITLR